MKNTIIFLGIVIIIKFIVKELSKPNKQKDIIEDGHQIEPYLKLICDSPKYLLCVVFIYDKQCYTLKMT